MWYYWVVRGPVLAALSAGCEKHLNKWLHHAPVLGTCQMGGTGSEPGQLTRDGRAVGVASLVLLLLSCTLVRGEQEEEVVTETDEPECFDDETVDCAIELLEGQYLCTNLDIDTETQQLRGCKLSNGTGRVSYSWSWLSSSGQIDETFVLKLRLKCFWCTPWYMKIILVIHSY